MFSFHEEKSAQFLPDFFCAVPAGILFSGMPVFFFRSRQRKGKRVKEEEKIRWAVETLRRRQTELERLPRRCDFDKATLCRIKAYLGPLPRALEKAGLKPAAEKQNN